MILLFLLLFPAGISLKIKDDYFKEELKNIDYVLLYMKYTFIINLIMFLVWFIYSNGGSISISLSFDDLEFILKYMVLSLILAVIVPIIDEYVRNCINLKINMNVKEVKYVKKNK